MTRKLLLSASILAIVSIASGQNSRLSKITQLKTTYSGIDTSVTSYNYSGGKLQSMVTPRGKYCDSVVFAYTGNDVILKKWFWSNKEQKWKLYEKWYDVKRSFENGKLVSWESSNRDYKVVYKGDKVVKWTEDKKSDRPVYRYFFSYNTKGDLDTITGENFHKGTWKSFNTKRYRTYSNNQPTTFTWSFPTSEIERYELVWENGRLISKVKIRDGKSSEKHTFHYDINGNIIREELSNSKAEISQVYLIEYEPGESNDDILFGLNSWYNYPINIFFGAKTYVPHRDMSY